MASFMLNASVADVADNTINLLTDTIVAIPLEGTPVLETVKDGTNVLSTLLSANLTEFTGTGYVGGHGGAGRIALTGRTIVPDNTTNKITFDAADVGGTGTDWDNFSSGTMTGVLIAKAGTVDDTDGIGIAVIDIADVSPNGTPITVSWSTSGILEWAN